MARQGKAISFGKYKLNVPSLFASYRLGDYPGAGLNFFPWDITGTEALLINAYDFKRPKYQALINNGWQSSTQLNFPNKPILIDSGAYYFIKHDKVSITPNDILEVELKSKADVGVVLDHPFPPDATDKARRITTTIKNTETMLAAYIAKKRRMKLMPVVHGHTPQAIRGCIFRLKNLMEFYGQLNLDRVGIGSVAPLAKHGKSQLAVEIIQTVRRQLPNSHVHCFSMGSGLLMLLAFYCGADTVDSQSWILSAAFKLAQLPGHYVVRMARRHYKTYYDFRKSIKLFADRLKRLKEEEGFSVKDWSSGEIIDIEPESNRMQYIQSLVDIRANENIHNRACHNLWVYNFEVQQYRKAVIGDRLENFIEARLRDTRYSTALEYARRCRLRLK